MVWQWYVESWRVDGKGIRDVGRIVVVIKTRKA
jgi:hypothetical protein